MCVAASFADASLAPLAEFSTRRRNVDRLTVPGERGRADKERDQRNDP